MERVEERNMEWEGGRGEESCGRKGNREFTATRLNQLADPEREVALQGHTRKSQQTSSTSGAKRKVGGMIRIVGNEWVWCKKKVKIMSINSSEFVYPLQITLW